MLHITNGESVIDSFRTAGLEGTYLAWLDVLHEGAVPDLPLAELSAVRAAALANLGWGESAEVRRSFAARDAMLGAFREHEEVVMWFEHDLFDQLQLIQVLDWFAGKDLAETRLSLIYMASHEQLAGLLPERMPITAAQLELGQAAWKAFRAPSPRAMGAMLSRDLPALPFLAAALRRFLEEYPSTENGLSRTEQQFLEAVAAGGRTRESIYLASQRHDSPIFLGDLQAWKRMDALASGPGPALEKIADEYQLTPHGRQCLAGEADWIRSRGGIDLWLGGTHLGGPDADWRWDRARGVLVSKRAGA